MELSANVKLHVIVPDTDPFILFGVEILTEYSRSIITKRFTDMSRFQNNLCYFAHTSCGQGKVLMDLLPTLPYPQPNLMSFSDSAIRERKEKVARYFKVLCELYNLYAHDQKLPWVKMIRQFINLDQIELKQKKAAIVIQRYYKKYLCKLALQEKTHDMYMAKGYVGKLEAIPDCLLIYTFSFLELKDFLRIAIVNKRWGQISEQPILWISLNLFQSKIKIEGVRFQMICQRAWRLKVIDLRYCQFINSESLRAISQYCNPES